MADSIGPVPQSMRDRIAMVRVLCIGFMIFVHVPDNAFSAAEFSVGVPLASWLTQGVLVEGLGRASAALLSLVSGILTAVALTRAKPSSLYRRRFRSIVVPMIIWSTVTVIVYAALSLIRPTFLTLGDVPPLQALLFYVNTIFFLTDQPMGPTLHLGFLRDLFVCLLLSPILVALLRRIGRVLLLLLAVVYLLDLESVFILRPLILLAFCIGLWLMQTGRDLEAADDYWPLWVVLLLVATSLVILSGTERGLAWPPAQWLAARGIDFREMFVYPLSRIFGALAIWSLAAKLVGTGWTDRLSRVSPYVFVAFCSHYLVLVFLWEGMVRRLVGGHATAGFAVWFVLAPFIAMFAAMVIVEVLARIAPSLAALLTGGRAGSVRAREPG